MVEPSGQLVTFPAGLNSNLQSMEAVSLQAHSSNFVVDFGNTMEDVEFGAHSSHFTERVSTLPLVSVNNGIDGTKCNGTLIVQQQPPPPQLILQQPQLQLVVQQPPPPPQPVVQQPPPQPVVQEPSQIAAQEPSQIAAQEPSQIAAQQPSPPLPSVQQSTPPTTNNTTTTTTQPPAKRTSKDFRFGKVIGEGSFSTVYLTKDVYTSKEYAIKVCDKRHIIREKKSEYIRRERDVLNILSSAGVPFFVKLFCTFQDPEDLYFVISYAKNGELLPYITKVGSFDTTCTRFYAGEIVSALEYLHGLKIIHRDLKPENILLDDKMHILITDFGEAKILEAADENNTNSTERKRRNSFVGTAQYVSPELLTDKTAHYTSDLWAFGCIVYQMVAGLPPFRARSEYTIFQKIQKLEYEFPPGFDPDAQDLVQKLLVTEPNERLGANDPKGPRGYPSIREHKFFEGLDFDTLLTQTPPTIATNLQVSNYIVPDHLEPGLDKQLSRLLGLAEAEEINGATSPTEDLSSTEGATGNYSGPKKPGVSAALRDPKLKEARLADQVANSKWHQFVEGRLILKQGYIHKRKGLFARRRMFLLTEGPRLFYVDPQTMTLKGEVPFSNELTVEAKNFKIFFIHTPNRTYYLEEPEGFALDWCKAIEEMKAFVL